MAAFLAALLHALKIMAILLGGLAGVVVLVVAIIILLILTSRGNPFQ